MDIKERREKLISDLAKENETHLINSQRLEGAIWMCNEILNEGVEQLVSTAEFISDAEMKAETGAQ